MFHSCPNCGRDTDSQTVHACAPRCKTCGRPIVHESTHVCRYAAPLSPRIALSMLEHASQHLTYNGIGFRVDATQSAQRMLVAASKSVWLDVADNVGLRRK